MYSFPCLLLLCRSASLLSWLALVQVRSRFPTVIHFEDYTASEHMQIAELMVEKQDLKLTPGAKEVLKQRFKTMTQPATNIKGNGSIRGRQGGGNGRAVRNMVEKAMRNQAVRLAQFKNTIHKDQLRDLVASDFEVSACAPRC